MSEQLPFRIKRSAVEGKRPQNEDLELGELALNTYDGRLFAKKDTGGVGVGTTVTLLTPWTENIGGGLYYNEGNVGIGTTTPSTKLFVQGDGYFTGILTAQQIVSKLYGEFTGEITDSNITGIALSISGISTSGSYYIGTSQVISSNRQLQNITSLDSITTATIENAIQQAPNDFTSLNISGISTLGTVQISSGIISATTGIVTYYGDASNLTKTFPLVTNVLYVTKNGNDGNPGTRLSEPKSTIAGAVAAATAGTVIKVSAGTYIENNPITLPDQVSIVGDSLREVTITPQNTGDLFYVGNGNYIAEMSFAGAATTGAIFSFDPNSIRYFNQSPYIQNCTNFIQNSTGLKIDGNNAIGPTKSMVLDSYTQYNQGGIGVSITNEGYAQLVSLFTICNDTAVYCGSGAACDLTNSNSSFGNYALVADGVGPRKYTGIITAASAANADTFTLDLNTPILSISNVLYNNVTGLATVTTSTSHGFAVGMGISLSGIGFTCLANPGAGTTTYPSGPNYVFEVKSSPTSNSFTVNVGPSTTSGQTYTSGGEAKINVSRPFDGQVVYFESLYYTVGSVVVGTGGTGYTSTPTVTISAPEAPWGVGASAVADISNGSVIGFEMVSNGRGYGSTPPTVTISAPNSGINTSTATAVLVPTYYTIKSSTPISSGICTITVNENLPYALGVGTAVPFFKQSRVLASGHSFEYIGSGTQISSALPTTGGVPIQENETVSRNGGLVVYTSTDQSGNFRIGDGVVVNQQTGTISGTFYSKSLFSAMTPFILALGGR